MTTPTTQTKGQLIEEALEKIDKKLKVFYTPGSFDVFNLRVAIEKQLSTIASKSAEAERERIIKSLPFHIEQTLDSLNGCGVGPDTHSYRLVENWLNNLETSIEMAEEAL